MCAYTDLNQIDNENLIEMIKSVNDKLLNVDTTVPNVGLLKMRKIIKIDLIIEEGKANVLVKFPIVLKEVFKELFVFPTPHPSSNLIADMAPRTVLLNMVSGHYINKTEIVPIDTKTSITKDINTMIFFVGEGDCDLKTLLSKKESCPLISLPPKFDNWCETPETNTFAFISNDRKAIQCITNTTIIEATAGLITVHEGCTILTPTRHIHPKPEHDTKILGKYFIKLQVWEFEIKLDTLTLITLNETKPIDLSKLEMAQMEADDLTSIIDGWSTFEIVLTTIISTLTIILIALITIVVKVLKSKKKNQNTNKKINNEENEKF